jgi:hypothetical protein
MMGLLMPEVAVNVTAFQQFVMPPDILHPASVENHDGIRRNQGGQAMRDDNQGAALRDP